MKHKVRIGILAGVCFVFVASFLPDAAYARGEEEQGPLGDCLTVAGGDRDAFVICLDENITEIAAVYKLPEGWQERIKGFIENHENWSMGIRAILDRLENRIDRLENRKDTQEDHRDRREDFRDWREDWHDEEFDREDLFDRREDRRDRAEDRRDRIENWRDRLEDRRDRRWP